MNSVKVAQSGAKVGIYTAVGAAVETFVLIYLPSLATVPGLGNGGITVGVSIALASLVNFLKHRNKSV